MMKGKKNRWAMLEQSFLSLFITFSIIELTNRGAGVVDGLFVSNFLDYKAVASVGVVKSIFSITGVVSGMLSVGMQSKCSHELGKGDQKGFNRIFSTMFYISVAVSIVCMVALLIGAKPLAALMGATGDGADLLDGAADYLRGIGIGFPSILLAVVLSVACQLDSAKRRVRVAGVINFICNCVLDYIVIKLGWGVFGIGLSTSLARYLQVGYLLLHFRTKDRMLHFSKFDMGLREILDTLYLGTEKALRSLGKVISPMIVNRIIIYYGGMMTMSAFSIQKDFMEVAEIFACGLADATALQAGVYYGEMNRETMGAMGKSAHKFCGIFLGTLGIIMVLFSKPIAGFYISEQGDLFNMVAFSSIVIGIYSPLNGLIRARLSYLNAVKKVRSMQIMTALSSVIYVVISAFLLGSLFGAYGVLTSNLLLTVMLLLTVWLYYTIQVKSIRPSGNDYLALPDSFDLKPGDVISLDIRDEEDVSVVAEQIQLFCKGHKVDESIGMKAALCFEELAMNIIKYGFPKCKGQPSIDLRLVFTNEGMTLRIRDNCPMFDVERCLVEKVNAAEEEGELHLGLKIIGSLADNLSYVHSLETNNVILKLPIAYRNEG